MTGSNPTNKAIWQPYPGLMSHSGLPIQTNAEFFAPPPPAIGELISAGTDLLTSEKMSKPKRNGIIAGSVGITLILLSMVIPGIGTKALSLQLIGGFFLIFAARSFLNHFKHTCTYVGINGVVKYNQTILTVNRPTEKMLIFTSDLALYSHLTDRYVNGRYSATHYSYGWKDRKGFGGSKLSLVDYYKSENRPPDDKNIWHFFNAAEAAWTNYLLKNIDGQLTEDGCLEFPITNGPNSLYMVRVNKKFLEFVTQKHGVKRVNAEEIQLLSTTNCIFKLDHVNSDWWSERGRSSFSVDNTPGQFSFEYRYIPNVRLFLSCLQSLKQQ
jgi:hypothetical protein